MKMIAITSVLILGLAAPCFGVGDPVPSVTRDEKSETTTFQRDGKTILKIIDYHSPDPQRRMLRQAVILNDEVVLELVSFRGKRSFVIHPKPHVSVGIQQDSTTGVLESLGLMDDSNVPIEVFDVKDSRLAPVSGKKLELNRAVIKDVGGLLQGVVKKKTTPEEFMDHVGELVKKYKGKESDNEQVIRGDISRRQKRHLHKRPAREKVRLAIY